MSTYYTLACEERRVRIELPGGPDYWLGCLEVAADAFVVGFVETVYAYDEAKHDYSATKTVRFMNAADAREAFARGEIADDVLAAALATFGDEP